MANMILLIRSHNSSSNAGKDGCMRNGLSLLTSDCCCLKCCCCPFLLISDYCCLKCCCCLFLLISKCWSLATLKELNVLLDIRLYLSGLVN